MRSNNKKHSRFVCFIWKEFSSSVQLRLWSCCNSVNVANFPLARCEVSPRVNSDLRAAALKPVAGMTLQSAAVLFELCVWGGRQRHFKVTSVLFSLCIVLKRPTLFVCGRVSYVSTAAFEGTKHRLGWWRFSLFRSHYIHKLGYIMSSEFLAEVFGDISSRNTSPVVCVLALGYIRTTDSSTFWCLPPTNS